ncbi:MAG: cysteine--tRNA ligase [Candidatus Helarchaeota archaeon]|nr:cysteine--tRNA ligase [Candidatus Helarchaeota archaeon]
MSIQIYNTLTKRKEEFVPIKKGEVSFYLCGPTVYDYFHIGNARAWIVFDVIRRYFEYRGYNVKYVVNLTDVDDKIINRANELGVHPNEVAEKYAEAYFEDCRRLKIKDATYNPKATAHIKQMQDLVSVLLEKGYAYVLDGDVYFEINRYSEYGKLSGKRTDDLIAGHRVETNQRKRNPLDFALWKRAKEGEVCWDSPWGKGRPGWHIECSAMSMKYLGKEFDIHAGAEDLIFPHHENEIAQSRCATDGEFARYWIHIGFLRIGKEKMSKSLGNIYTAREILNEFSQESIRLFFMQKHYKSPIEFGKDILSDAENAVQRLKRCYFKLKETLEKYNAEDNLSYNKSNDIIQNFREEIISSMDDDFNSAVSVSKIFELVKMVNEKMEDEYYVSNKIHLLKDAKNLFDEVNKFFDIIPITYETSENTEKLLEILLNIRDELRKKKEYNLADRIRSELEKLGYIIEDRTLGTKWIKK